MSTSKTDTDGGALGQITDDAEELARLWSDILRYSPKETRPTYAVLADYLGVGSRHGLMLRLLGSIAQRIEKLRQSIQLTNHPLVAPDYRSSLDSALSNMTELIGPSSMGRSWNDNRQRVHSAEVAVVGSYSHIARSMQPLRLLDSDERTELKVRIQETIAELDQDEGIERWAAEFLIRSLVEAELVIDHLPVLGHGAIVEGLLGLRERYEYVAAVAREPTRSDRPRPSLMAVANVLLVGFNLVTIPPQAEAYVGWYGDKVAMIFQNFHGDQDHRPPAAPYTPLLPSPAKREDEL